MLTQRQDIRRRLDGSIDIDFYRKKVERRAHMTNFFSGAKKLVRPLVAAAVLAGTVYMMPARDGDGWNGPSVSGTRMNSASLANPVSATH